MFLLCNTAITITMFENKTLYQTDLGAQCTSNLFSTQSLILHPGNSVSYRRNGLHTDGDPEHVAHALTKIFRSYMSKR